MSEAPKQDWDEWQGFGGTVSRRVVLSGVVPHAANGSGQMRKRTQIAAGNYSLGNRSNEPHQNLEDESAEVGKSCNCRHQQEHSVGIECGIGGIGGIAGVPITGALHCRLMYVQFVTGPGRIIGFETAIRCDAFRFLVAD
jgi:hypothetical protein